MGYNGFPRGCSDDEFPWGKDEETTDPYSAKYLYVTHSELNAILNYRGGSLEAVSYTHLGISLVQRQSFMKVDEVALELGISKSCAVRCSTGLTKNCRKKAI